MLNGTHAQRNGLAASPTQCLSPEDVARQLGGKRARRAGNGWLTCCPAHDDADPSLSVGVGDNGGLVFHCHAGCSQMAVLTALECQGIGAVHPESHATPAQRRKGATHTETYAYRGSDGQLIYEKLRFKGGAKGKTFRQRHPNGVGGWIWSLNGVQRPLPPNRLPELIASGHQEVHACEGEKDADRLAKLGLISTSIDTPSETDLSALSARTVFIHEDNDPAGRAKSARLATALNGIAAQVVIVSYSEAGNSGDVSDWLDRGHDLEDLLARCDEAANAPSDAEDQERPLPSEQPAYVSRCLADVAPEPIEWLWHGRFARGKANLIAGQPGLGKTQTAVYMAARVSVGGEWPDGTRCPRGLVILICCEDDAADTIVPRLIAVGADLSRVHILDWIVKKSGQGTPSQQLFNLAHDVPSLASLVCKIGDVALIVIDPISAYLGGLDSHKTSDVRGGLAPLQHLAGETGAAVVLISHLNKGSADANAMARVAGSGAFVAACRSAWLVEADPQDEDRKRRILTPLKNNIGDDQTGFAFEIKGVTLQEGIETSCVVFEPEPVLISASELLKGQQDSQEERGMVGEAMTFLREYLADGPKGTKVTQKAAEEAGIAERTLRRAREQLKVKVHRSRQTGQWVWALPERTPPHPSDCVVGQGGHVVQEDLGPEAGQVVSCKASLATPEGNSQVGQVGQHGQDQACSDDQTGVA
jgi:putative DNA primase/helicase